MLPRLTAKYVGLGPVSLARLSHKFEDEEDDIEFLARPGCGFGPYGSRTKDIPRLLHSNAQGSLSMTERKFEQIDVEAAAEDLVDFVRGLVKPWVDFRGHEKNFADIMRKHIVDGEITRKS